MPNVEHVLASKHCERPDDVGVLFVTQIFYYNFRCRFNNIHFTPISVPGGYPKLTPCPSLRHLDGIAAPARPPSPRTPTLLGPIRPSCTLRSPLLFCCEAGGATGAIAGWRAKQQSFQQARKDYTIKKCVPPQRRGALRARGAALCRSAASLRPSRLCEAASRQGFGRTARETSAWAPSAGALRPIHLCGLFGSAQRARAALLSWRGQVGVADEWRCRHQPGHGRVLVRAARCTMEWA